MSSVGTAFCCCSGALRTSPSRDGLSNSSLPADTADDSGSVQPSSRAACSRRVFAARSTEPGVPETGPRRVRRERPMATPDAGFRVFAPGLLRAASGADGGPGVRPSPLPRFDCAPVVPFQSSGPRPFGAFPAAREVSRCLFIRRFPALGRTLRLCRRISIRGSSSLWITSLSI